MPSTGKIIKEAMENKKTANVAKSVITTANVAKSVITTPNKVTFDGLAKKYHKAKVFTEAIKNSYGIRKKQTDAKKYYRLVTKQNAAEHKDYSKYWKHEPPMYNDSIRCI